MSKLFSIITVVAAGLYVGCDVNIHVGNGEIVKGSGRVVSERREISAFNSVDLAGAMDVEVTHSDTFKCTLRGDDNILPLIATEIRGQRLCLSTKQSYSTRQRLVVLLEAPELTEVVLNGSGNINMAGVTKDTIVIRIAGSGNIVASGAAKQVTAEISGAGNLMLGGLAAENVDVVISGSGDANVWAKQSLHARVNGSGDILYSGNPEKVQTHVNGSGRIVKK
jgi:hypothetical protein